MGELLTLAFSSILIQNVVLQRFLGICPFMGVSNKRESSIGMGLAVVFVITISSCISWLIYKYVLVQFDMVYMKTIMFILIIASFVQIIEMFIKKVSPSLYKSLGIYLPLITTNCAVLGMATIVASDEYNFLEAFVVSFSSAIGFLFVMYVFSTLRERMANNDIPRGFKGVPIALVTASILAMIFARFAGVI